MTIIYVTENNTERLAVTFKNNGFVKIQKFEDVSDDKNISICQKLKTYKIHSNYD